MTKQELMGKAMNLISEYTREEFGEEADFTDISKIGIAYTTNEAEEYEIQVYANLVNFSIDIFIDGDLVETHKSDTLEDFIKYQLRFLEFDDLVASYI